MLYVNYSSIMLVAAVEGGRVGHWRAEWKLNRMDGACWQWYSLKDDLTKPCLWGTSKGSVSLSFLDFLHSLEKTLPISCLGSICLITYILWADKDWKSQYSTCKNFIYYPWLQQSTHLPSAFYCFVVFLVLVPLFYPLQKICL